MNLELTRTEADELHGVLGSYLSELRMEIADTEVTTTARVSRPKGPC